MEIKDIIGMIGGIIGIIVAIITLTRYLTQLHLKIEKERLITAKENAETKIGDLEAKNKELLNEILITKRVGSAAIVKKKEIDYDFLSIIKKMRAETGSIYIPLTPKSSSKPLGLVFLSMQPVLQETAKLKKKIIPMQSKAGICFDEDFSFTSSDLKKNPGFSDKADKITGFNTDEMMNIPLRYRGETIGVLQLLNKEGGERFTKSDIQDIEPFIQPLADKVYEFASTPENLEILGVRPDRDTEYATVMFCDLTKSATLFKEMNASMAIQHINEYLEHISDIALKYGATVDRYTGDGVMFRFNVPRPVDDHQFTAVSAALEMVSAFEKLKSDWTVLGGPMSGIYTRIGISYGEVYQATIGHPQYQYLTIFGQTVIVASNLCEAAVRDRNVIVIDERMHNELGNRVIAEKIPQEQLGKATSLIESAYEIQGLS